MNSQPISVISEYKKLNLDFEELLDDREKLDKLLKEAEEAKNEIEDTLKATQFCYNQNPNLANKQILEETNKEAIKIKYRLRMLKIIDLVSTECLNYQDAKKKREKLLELIEARIIYQKSLGVHILVEPFKRTKVKEQLDSLITMTDNTQTISDIRKEIATLTARTEEMTNQNNNYLILLSNTKNLIEDSISFADIDVTDVDLHVELPRPKVVTDNQIIKIRNATKINMSIVSQKTESVIKRVNQMINGKQSKKIETRATFAPNLVIVPKKTEIIESKIDETFTPSLQKDITYEEVDTPKIVSTLETTGDIFTFDSELNDENIVSGNLDYLNDIEEDNDDEIVMEPQITEIKPVAELSPQAAEKNDDLFTTIIPFTAPTMFNDRTDEPIQKITPKVIEFPTPEREIQPKILETPITDTSPSESFWPIQENFVQTEEYDEDDKQTLSFDEQINMLMSSESKDSKVLKKVA